MTRSRSTADTPASPPPSKGAAQKQTIYRVKKIFHHPLTSDHKQACERWRKGVEVIQEDPSQSYLDQFNIFPGPWTFYQWGRWYRLLDSDGSQYLDYYILSDKEVE